MDLQNEEMAPRTGFEPVTKWLTATYSTAELSGIAVITIFGSEIIQKENLKNS